MKHHLTCPQKLKDVTLGSLTILERFLTINRSSLEDLFTDAEELIFGSVEKFREPDTPRQETAIERFVKRILNSPIVKLILKFNPLKWILEGISEGISESFSDFKLPDIKPLAEAIGMTADALLEVFLTAFGQIIDTIAASGTEALLNPKEMLRIIVSAVKKTFRTLFHATRDTVLIAVDCVIRMVHAIPALLAEPWVIPGLTDLWEDWTGQEFSLLNFATYGSAILLDLMTIAVPDKQKTAVFGKPFRQGWAESLKMEPMYTSFRERADQAALAARYPGPSRPEDTSPIVMMVMTDYGTMQKEGGEKPPAEAEETNEDDSDFGDWMSMVGGIFKFITNGIIVYQAKVPDQGIGGKMIGFKIVSAVVALAAMAGEGVSYFTSSSGQANQDPKDVANLVKSAPCPPVTTNPSVTNSPTTPALGSKLWHERRPVRRHPRCRRRGLYGHYQGAHGHSAQEPEPQPLLRDGQEAGAAAEQGGALRRRDGLEPRRGGHGRLRARVLDQAALGEYLPDGRWRWGCGGCCGGKLL